MSVERPAPPSEADRSDVSRAVRAYIDSWHSSDADGMAATLHPRLVKRSPTAESTATTDGLMEVTRAQMIEFTSEGGGGDPSAESEVIVEHVEGDIASARVATAAYLDYVHLVRSAEGWQIVNDLFRMR